MTLRTGIASLDIFLCVLACIVAVHWATRSTRLPEGLRLPPGPRGMPIIGNLAGVLGNQDREYKAVTQWAHDYGELVHINVLGISIVYVNSLHVARELFDKRSTIYSDRFNFPMLMLMGWLGNIAFMPYGEAWRRHRKAFHQYFNPTAATVYHPVQTRQTRLHATPEDFAEHIGHLSGAIIVEIVYGLQVQPKNDRYVDIAKKALEGASQAAYPGTYLVDIWPILKYVPEWFPGAGFQRKARIWREPTLEMSAAPFRVVKEALAAGAAEPSITASMLAKLSLEEETSPEEEEIILNTGASSYAGGAGTTNIAMLTFFLAMVLYPEVQRKAQTEIDSVIGSNRLPDFADRSNLPYINALCTEIHRWHPVLPLGVSHRVIQDDSYQGFFIPKGSLVIGNTWAMLHDERTYGPRPEEFEPERFLRPGISSPTEQYGFGRRICPGRYMAGNSIFIAVVSILTVFNISHARDENGNEIPVKEIYTSGAISLPEPFKCSIKPRSASAEKLILGRDDI